VDKLPLDALRSQIEALEAKCNLYRKHLDEALENNIRLLSKLMAAEEVILRFEKERLKTAVIQSPGALS